MLTLHPKSHIRKVYQDNDEKNIGYIGSGPPAGTYMGTGTDQHEESQDRRLHAEDNEDSSFYPYWHTLKDNIEQIDSKTLGMVGDVVVNVIYRQ